MMVPKIEEDKFSVVEPTAEAMESYQSGNRLHGFGMIRLSIEEFALLQEGKMLACHDGEYATFIKLGG